MDQQRSGRPASASRRGRRSLAEFALPASGTPAAMPAATPPLPTAQPEPAPRQAEQPIKKSKKGRHKREREPVNEDQDVAASGARQTKKRDAAMSEDDAKLHQIEALTSAAARAAKDYQAW